MRIEPNPNPDPLRVEPIKRGDFVEARFAFDVNSGLSGYVARINDARLDLRVHQAFGAISGNGVGDLTKCLAWNVAIPWHSVLWVRHLRGRATECPCSEGL